VKRIVEWLKSKRAWWDLLLVLVAFVFLCIADFGGLFGRSRLYDLILYFGNFLFVVGCLAFITGIILST
jgi:hypothetical protein